LPIVNAGPSAAIRQVPLAPGMVKKLAEHKLASDY
jgi:hypothetical protein